MIAALSPYVCVVVLQLVLLYPLHRTMDLPIWDEAIYLLQGGWFVHGDTLGPISISPVYSLLYSLMIKMFGVVDSVFYMQYLVKVTVSGLLLLCLVGHLRSRLLALLFTLIWVVSGVNIFERVLVYHVALGVFLLALFSLNKHRGISLLLLVLCSLTRLEYLFPTFIAERRELLYLTVASLLSLAPILLVYPRPHHTLIMVPFCLLWAGLACLQLLKTINSPQFTRWSLTTLNALFMLATLVISKPYAYQQP